MLDGVGSAMQDAPALFVAPRLVSQTTLWCLAVQQLQQPEAAFGTQVCTA